MTARPRRVLLIEDDVDQRRLLSAGLRADGHKVSEGADGVDVLERMESTIWPARRDLFDVIVSDLNMPGRGGLEVLSALRAASWDVPLILITAFGDAAMVANASGLGASAVLLKPVGRADLQRAVLAAERVP